MNVIIRPEEKDDYERVEKVTRDAFWNLYAPGCDEHYLSHIMRSHEDFIGELDYVAEINGEIIGSIMYTKSLLIGEDSERMPIVSFGPLCVLPEYQRQGVGTALIDKTKQIVRGMNVPAIVIYGDPHNYCKHGFKNGIDYCVSDMDGEYPMGLLVLELRQGFFGTKHWRARQSEVFKYEQEKALEFDSKFEPKEKKTQYSQELFKIQIRSFLRGAGLSTSST